MGRQESQKKGAGAAAFQRPSPSWRLGPKRRHSHCVAVCVQKREELFFAEGEEEDAAGWAAGMALTSPVEIPLPEPWGLDSGLTFVPATVALHIDAGEDGSLLQEVRVPHRSGLGTPCSCMQEQGSI